MENEKKRLYITILEEDLNLLIQEANTLGISKSNYAFLILYLFKDISLSTEEIEKYTEKVNNKEGKIASFYLTLSPYMSKIHANKKRDIFSINQYIATIIHCYLKTSKVPRSTEKGISLCEVIKEDPIANASMTAKWEKYLYKIKEKQGTQEAFIDSIERFIEHTINTVPDNFKNSDIQQYAKKIMDDKVIGICPKCQQNILDKGKFYGCDDYPNCKFTLPKKWSGKTIPKKNIQELLEKGITSEIKGFKSKKGKAFNTKLKIENNKITFNFDK